MTIDRSSSGGRAPQSNCCIFNDDFYNTNETGLFFRLLPSKTLVVKTGKCVAGKDRKYRITVLICTNMDGSDNRDMLVPGKAKEFSFTKVFSMPVT